MSALVAEELLCLAKRHEIRLVATFVKRKCSSKSVQVSMVEKGEFVAGGTNVD